MTQKSYKMCLKSSCTVFGISKDICILSNKVTLGYDAGIYFCQTVSCNLICTASIRWWMKHHLLDLIKKISWIPHFDPRIYCHTYLWIKPMSENCRAQDGLFPHHKSSFFFKAMCLHSFAPTLNENKRFLRGVLQWGSPVTPVHFRHPFFGTKVCCKNETYLPVGTFRGGWYVLEENNIMKTHINVYQPPKRTHWWLRFEMYFLLQQTPVKDWLWERRMEQ